MRRPKIREPEGIRTIAQEWAHWPGSKHCPSCGCSPPYPCLLFMPPVGPHEVVPEGTSEGLCVPAGVFGFGECSACQQSAEMGYRVHGKAVAHNVAKILDALDG